MIQSEYKMISIDRHGNVAIVKLERGVTNALNLGLVRGLADTLEKLKQDSGVRSVVLRSANDKFFSIGFDIPELYELREEAFERFYRAFNETCMDLYTFPKPTVAAITGHATAGGCILALCCDYRLIADGRKLMGLNEVKLGVPIPHLADCILRSLVGTPNARVISDAGEFYTPEKSIQMGLVDHIWPLPELLTKAIEKAESLGTLPTMAFSVIKQNRVENISKQVLKRKEQKERLFVESWFSKDARDRLRAAIEKF